MIKIIAQIAMVALKSVECIIYRLKYLSATRAIWSVKRAYMYMHSHCAHAYIYARVRMRIREHP